MAWKKTAKENQIPNTTPLVTNDCSMINQAYGAMRWPAIVAALLAAEASTLLYTMVRLTRQAPAQLTRGSTRPTGVSCPYRETFAAPLYHKAYAAAAKNGERVASWVML